MVCFQVECHMLWWCIQDFHIGLEEWGGGIGGRRHAFYRIDVNENLALCPLFEGLQAPRPWVRERRGTSAWEILRSHPPMLNPNSRSAQTFSCSKETEAMLLNHN